MKNVFCCLWAAVTAAFLPFSVQGSDLCPQAFLVGGDASTCVSVLSDNGQWGLAVKVGAQDVDNPQAAGGIIVETATGKTTAVPAGQRTGVAKPTDITDNGSLVVGMADYVPASWSAATGVWTTYALPEGFDTGSFLAVTPDGTRAVGYAGTSMDLNRATPILYDFRTGGYVDLPNMPYIGMTGRNYHENAPCGLSADGRYIFGMVAESYMMDDFRSVMWAYVYDTTDNTYQPIGWSIDKDFKFTPQYEGQNFIQMLKPSPSGEWVTGVIRMAKPIPGSQFNNDYCIPFVYHTPTGSFEIFDEEASHDVGAFSIDDNGTIYGAMPWENPYPDACVRSGKYFYSYDRIFKEVYNFSLESAIRDYVTGKPVAVSADGLTQAMINGDGVGYVLRLKEPLANASAGIDLLGNYSATPAAGSVMTKIKTIQLTFDRSIAFNGDYSQIKVLDDGGNVFLTALSSTSVLTSNDHVLSVGLRTATMEKGRTYTLAIPSGLITIKGDNSIKNREIRLSYTGRGDDAVKLLTVYPFDGSSVARIDGASNPIVLTYDSELQLSDPQPAVYLYEGDYRDPKATLYAAVNGKTVYLYPNSTQYLFNGTDYTVEVPAGLVTDLSGNGASQALRLEYHGLYVREVMADDIYLFRADGSADAYLQFITYDGDELNPAETPASWGFASNIAWWGVMSSDTSTDRAFVSHSMYSPAGQSDDWMMTPQLFVPDENVTLSFDVQGYKKNKKDRLKVYVFTSSDGYNSLSRELTEQIRTRGKLIHDAVAQPGALEESLEGEWTHCSYSLAEWAGKDIYIAFVNDNRDQSAVFVDNVEVMRNIKYMASFKHPATVVGRDNITIEGVIVANSDTETFDNLKMTLLDAEGKTISTLARTGLGLKKGSTLDFKFDKLMPLTIGRENFFTVEIDLDGNKTTLSESIKDLVFEPVKKVVLEEFTGSECGNCPLGILAIDRLKEMYPQNFLPITLRCYQSDMLGAGVTGYASYLGLNAAPSALINRQPEVYYPAYSEGNDYYFSGEGLIQADGTEPQLWHDVVRKELETSAEAGIEFNVAYDAKTRSLTIPCRVRYALDTTQKSVKLFAVVLEDQLTTYQMNYMSGVKCDALLPWSVGGALAQGATMYTFDDVARAAIGQTYSGTGGLLPTEFKAGTVYEATISGELPTSIEDGKVAYAKVVVMMIDELSGRVINANMATVGGSTDGIAAAKPDATGLTVRAANGTVIATSANDMEVVLGVYAPDGRLIAMANGSGYASADLGGYRGFVLVRAATQGSAATTKIVLK